LLYNRSMRRILSKLICVLAVLIIGGSLLHPLSAQAAGFTPNNLMDDSVFDNSGSMSFQAIDNWINANFPSSCISTNHGFQAQIPTGYTPGGGFTYGGNVSAGHVIYDAAAAYGLNPQVLLTTLQKEQSLVSGGGGCGTLAYAGAMGYGCPDGGTTYSYSGVNLYSINGVVQSAVSGTCVNSAAKVGFSEQVIHAAWLLKFGEQRSEGNTGFNVQNTNFPSPGDHWDNSDDPPTCYGGPMTQGSFKRCQTDSPVFYDGYTTIDGSSTHMDTGPTAALYWYTPHFNGNQNFDNLFTAWFGSPYGSTIGSTAYELFNFGTLKHYYTARQNERFAVKQQGFSDTSGGFSVGSTQQAGMVPIYREYNGRLKDYWLLPDGPNRWWALNRGGYGDEGVAFFAYPSNTGSGGAACSQGTPVYQLWQGGATNHYYSTVNLNRYWSIIFGGYIDDGSGNYFNGNVGSVSFCAPS
jgi:hypothetical protein